MARKTDRLNRLEKAVNPPGPSEIFVCWCDLPDGEHNADCPAHGKSDSDFTKVGWPEFIRVRYNRSPPIPSDNHNISEWGF